MRRHFFTLTELLVTIAIILILAGILIPVTSSAIAKSEQAKCQAAMSTLANAINQFQTQYGKMPGKLFKDGSTEVVPLPAGNYEKFIKMLQGQPVASAPKENTRKIKFLESQSGDSYGDYVDPWGNNFEIYMDSNNSDTISTIPHGIKATTIYRSLIIWSKGPDGKSDGTATHEDNKDNVYSIPVEYEKGVGFKLAK